MEPAAASDAELIAATRAGSDEAFSLLYRRHLGAARAAAHTLIRSRTAAEDLVAEGFTRILAALRRGAGPEVAFRPYLLTCIKNAAYDRHRRDRRVELAPDVGETQADPTLVDPALLTEERHMIARAFTSLPDRWQAVLWHTEVEGMSAAAVAPILGLSPNSVSALHYRAREGLRQAFLQAHIGAATPVTCRASRNRLGRYVRNGLTPTEEAVVDRHLETCEGCRALLDELTNVDTSLRSVMVPLVVGGPAGAYLAGLSAGGLGAVGLGVGGLFGLPALKIGFIAASVLAVAAGVALTAYPDRPDRPTATTMVVAGDSAREEGDPGTGGAGAASSSGAPGAMGDPADQGAPGPTSTGTPTDPDAAATTVTGGALPLVTSPSQATGSGVLPTATAPAPGPPPPTAPSLIPPPVAPPLPTTLPTLPITLPTLPITLPTLAPLPTLPTLPPLPSLPTTLPTLPPLPSLPTTLPTLPPLPTSLPLLPPLPSLT